MVNIFKTNVENQAKQKSNKADVLCSNICNVRYTNLFAMHKYPFLAHTLYITIIFCEWTRAAQSHSFLMNSSLNSGWKSNLKVCCFNVHTKADKRWYERNIYTQNLLMGEAHDVHGLHGLMEVVLVLLARDWDVAIGQETIVVEALQQQVRCGHTNGKRAKSVAKMWYFRRVSNEQAKNRFVKTYQSIPFH